MSSSKCIACTFLNFLFFFIIIGIPLIVYYAQHPKDPTLTLDNASIHAFNLTSDGHLTSFFNLVITANNPNRRMKLDYSDVRVSIFKDKQNLAEDVLDDFAHRKRTVTLLKPEPVALNVSLNDGPRFDLGLESGMGYIDFDVFMTATLNGDELVVNCDHAIVNVTTISSLVASSPSISNNIAMQNFQIIDCSVRIFPSD